MESSLGGGELEEMTVHSDMVNQSKQQQQQQQQQ